MTTIQNGIRPPAARPGPGPSRPGPPRHLAELGYAQRREAVAALGEPPFRADQLSRHYFARLTDDPAEMTDLPAASRDRLAAALLPRLLTAERELSCDAGLTRKTLWRAQDNSLVESVLMRYPGRVTMCVSSQAGCGMGCPFCATGQAGLTRNLSAAEIVHQVVAGARALARGEVPGGRGRLSNVVFMGMGEPLANYARVVAAVRRLTEPVPAGLGISQRGITISTVGLVPGIWRLSGEGLPLRLAVSLHAPDDALRDKLVPVNRRWKVAEVLDAAWGYAAATGRRVSIEYALIRDINDQAWRADALAGLLAGRLAHVNVIPLNPTPGSAWTASGPAVLDEFVARLAGRGIAVTVRDTRGSEIDGACGQLAARALRPASPRGGRQPESGMRAQGDPLAPAGSRRIPLCRHEVEARARQAIPAGCRRARAPSLARCPACRDHHGGYPGRPGLRRLRPALADRVPHRSGVRREVDRHR
jgi:23S rRNA (adenine2503-C2)-methyltransferase